MGSTAITTMPSAADLSAVQFERHADGRLIYQATDGQQHVGVLAVRAFPLSRPERGISIVDASGHEALWIETLDQLSPASRAVLAEELGGREFRPVIERIVSVSTFATPSTWTVASDRGTHAFVLKAEEDIRRLEGARLLITSGNGVSYEIKDRWALDKGSRKLLERFL